MVETKKTYEQFCTYFKKNIIIEETLTREGKVVKKCMESKCSYKNELCRNKLCKIS